MRIGKWIRQVGRVSSAARSIGNTKGFPQSKLRAFSSASNPFAAPNGHLFPDLPKEEFQQRRENLFQVLPDDSALIVNGASVKYMTNDIPYEFRQSSNFLYLTGLEEPDAHAVFLKSQGKTSFVLFVRPRDAHSEQWDGARTGLDAAKEHFGADDAYQLSSLGTQLGKLVNNMKQVFVVGADANGAFPSSFINATKDIRGKLYNGDVFPEQLRIIKSEAELERMRFAADVGSKGFIEMMKATKPGIPEMALAGEFEGTCKRNGALWNSFPCVVGAGSNAAVIHYLSKRQMINPSELVLVDAGCEVSGGYLSDITRTWSSNGDWTDAQTQLYEFVLDVQKQSLDHLRSCIETGEQLSLDMLHQYSVKLMAERMREFGILKSTGTSHSETQAFRKYNPTHIGHYLGMDVHDTSNMSRGVALQPGMVITVEPGIYLPKDDESIPAELRGIGIRIEDDVAIGKNGLEILTHQVPKEVKDMEKLRQE